MEYWTLPGADAFLESIRAAVLEDRENVIVALPEHAAPDMAEAFKTKLHAARAKDPHHYMADGRELRDILYAAAGVSALDLPTVADLMQHMCESRPVIIDAITPDTAPPSLRFLQEYANASRNVDRVNPLVVITVGVCRGELPDNAPKLTSIVWDSWMSEADVLAFIVYQWRLQERELNRRYRLCARIIGHLALWDITLVQRLMMLAENNWEYLFDPEQILACLETNATRPGTWEAGGLARFDGEMYKHLYTFAQGDERRNELVRRLWAAQAAYLLPVLENRRCELIQAMHNTGKLKFNAESGSDFYTAELRELMSLVNAHSLPQALFRYADKLRRLRNQLAHLKPLSAKDADRLLHMSAPFFQENGEVPPSGR